MKTAADLLAEDTAREDRALAALARSGKTVQAKSASLGFAFNNPDYSAAPGTKLARPYAQSVWVQRAIKSISGPIAALPLDFMLETMQGEPQGYNDPKLSAYWKQPAIGLDCPDFIRASIGWKKLAGEFFWLMGDDAFLPFPEVRNMAMAGKLIVARPDRMRHVIERGELIGWVFTAGDGRNYNLMPEQVIHKKEWNPYDEWRGLSEYEAASLAAETDYLTAKFVNNLMRGNGDRGPYIISKQPLKPTDPQREQIIADLRQKRAAAQRGEHRPMFLTGDISVEDPQIQGMDASLVAIREQSKAEIFVAFGVPPSMAEPSPSYSVGSASDRYRLIEETCMPEACTLASAIDVVTQRLTGKPLHACFDWDENSTMQQVRAERIDQMTKLAALGMPVKDANDYLRTGMKPFPGWDRGYLPFSVQPVDAPLPESDPAMAEMDDMPDALPEGAVENMLQLLARRRAEKAVPVCGKKTKQIESAPEDAAWSDFVKSRPQTEAAMWKDQMAKMRESQKRYQSAIDRQLLAARAEMLQKIDAKYHPQSKAVTKAETDSLMFNLGEFKVGMFTKFARAARQALQTGGENLLKEVGQDSPFTLAHNEVVNFISERENKLADTPKAIWDQVRGALEQGVASGASRDDLAGMVKAAFNGVSDGRAKTIATTEANTAYSAGRDKAMKQSGIKWKRWLTSNNDNVRETHQEANGQVVPIDEPFMVGGEELMHPHDPNGSAKEVCNCHCVMIPEVNGPEGE